MAVGMQGDLGGRIPSSGFRGFTRGDLRGDIIAGSSSFLHLTGFDWPHVLGMPHRKLFGPLMPQGVLHHLNRRFRLRDIVMAYAHGVTQDQVGYWAVIICLPLDDGYVTLLMNPSSTIFPGIRDLYARLTLGETQQGISPEDSEKLFLAGLADLGFPDYVCFMEDATWAEFLEEFGQKTARLRGFVAIADRVRASLTRMQSLQTDLMAATALLRDLPTNMRIIASRLEPSGGPLTAMSDIYGSASAALSADIKEFATGASGLTEAMEGAFARACALKICSMVQVQVAEDFRQNPPDSGHFNLSDAFKTLDRLHSFCQSIEAQGLYDAQKRSQSINSASYDLRRSMLGLDTVRVMGLVESGRLGAEGARIKATMDQIGHSHEHIVTVLQKIKENAATIYAGVTELRNNFKRAEAVAAE